MNPASVGLIGGTGGEGQGIGLRLGAAGIEVNLGSRTLQKATDIADQLNRSLGRLTVVPMTNEHVVQRSDVLFLTVPFGHAQETLSALASSLREEQVVVDVTVPLTFEKGPQLMNLDGFSGSERVREWVPSGVPVVGAFKTLPAHLLQDLTSPLDCDEFLSGDSQTAKARVRSLLEHIPGLRWIDAGPLRSSRYLEAMTALVIGLNRRYKAKNGRFKVVGLNG